MKKNKIFLLFNRLAHTYSMNKLLKLATVLIFEIASAAIFMPIAIASFSTISDFDVFLIEEVFFGFDSNINSRMLNMFLYLASNNTIGTIKRKDVKQTAASFADVKSAMIMPKIIVENACKIILNGKPNA